MSDLTTHSSLYTILLVDDTPANLSLLIDALSKDYQVRVAESGESCLEQLPYCRPDLILMDLLMPGMNGLQCCAQINQQPEFADIPILFMTAVDDPEQRRLAIESGALDYVVKPVYIPEVLARVATHLRILALRRELQRQNELLELEVQMRRETEQQLEQSIRRGLMLIADDGQVLFVTRRAAHLVRLYYQAAGELTVPDEFVASWKNAVAENQFGWLKSKPTGEGTLKISLYAPKDSSGPTVFHLDEDQSKGLESLAALGLSPRESEVLFWMAEGKTYPEIAQILGAATRTIHKHSENLMRKLHVETRSSAMRMAIDALNSR
ncbi:MAG: response regulator [Verrucomicrobia bacterium]|nr:response regulator [Verrucomicrobiota bacterium]